MRWKCVISYDGTDFNGWQSQPCGNTIQDFVERRLEVLFRQKVRIHGSGRTDAGVHARGQVFHFDCAWSHGPDKLLRAFHSGLPRGIQITDARPVAEDFHARYSARGKRYIYRLYRGAAPAMDGRFMWSFGNRPLDLDAMQSAASILTGRHDFTGFSAVTGNASEPDPIRTVWKLDIAVRGRRITVRAEGEGFLYKMVRSLVGALTDVGTGRLTPDDIRMILRERKRTALIQTAPALGLCLDHVFYRLPAAYAQERHSR